MGTHSEGTSTNKPPLLDGDNYAYWKVRMVAFLKAIDLKVWKSIVNGYSLPTTTADGITSLKSEEKWSKDEEFAATNNSRALNAIYNGVNMSEFRRISTCTTAKEAWDILQTVHEGTDTVKQSKLQKLYTAFETIKMQDDETFDEFNSKLNAIVNDTFTLGEPIPENRVVKKILRSLPERFDAKVVAIEENKNLNVLKVEDLVGNLQTFEANLRTNEKSKSKGLALKASKESFKKIAIDSDSDSEEIDPLVAVEFMKQFQAFMKGKKSDLKIPKNSAKKKFSKGIQCFECHGYGHIASDCANKKSQKKAFNLTWDDDTSEEEDKKSEKSDASKEKFMAFMATSVSATPPLSDNESNQDVSKTEI